MKIQVHEVTQYNGAIVTTEGEIAPTNNGIKSTNVKTTVQFRGQTGRGANHLRQAQALPCNYRTIDRQTLASLLQATEYGKMYVSTLGKNITNFIEV